MSAFVVSKKQIDLILTFAIMKGFYFDRMMNPSNMYKVTEENASDIGQMLWDENHRSVNYRYKEDESTPSYTFKKTYIYSYSKEVWNEQTKTMERRTLESNINALSMINFLKCLDYQSCEHPEYKGSIAEHNINSWVSSACSHLPGYSDLPWAVS